MIRQLELPFGKNGSPEPDGYRRPTPPPGFVFFKWKTVGGTTRCPECGQFGTAYFGGGWQDPRAQKAYDDGMKKGIVLCGALDDKITCDGVAILSHWSRFCEGKCMGCAVQYWHDFGGASPGMASDWHYYYKPTGRKR